MFRDDILHHLQPADNTEKWFRVGSEGQDGMPVGYMGGLTQLSPYWNAWYTRKLKARDSEPLWSNMSRGLSGHGWRGVRRGTREARGSSQLAS